MSTLESFDAMKQQFPQHSQLLDQIKTFYNNKFWYQFGEALLTLTSYPEVKDSDFTMQIFNIVFDNPIVNIDKICMAILANRAVDRIAGRCFIEPEIDDKLKFFTKVEEYNKNPKAKILLESHKALCLTVADKKTEANELLRSLEPSISSLFNADKSMALYHLKVGDFQKFYNYSLQYLAYIDEGEITDDEKEDISVNMAIAILVSERIFNFSELAGLAQRKKVLEDKIKIMAFAELVFTLPKNERVVTFEQISKATSIPSNMIELMIIKAMSLDLLKGSIDEVNQVVSVTFIQPRVLDKERISTMKGKFINWQSSLQGLLQFVEEYRNSLKA